MNTCLNAEYVMLGCKKKILEYSNATNRINMIFWQLAENKFRQIQKSKAVWAMEVGILRATQKSKEEKAE